MQRIVIHDPDLDSQFLYEGYLGAVTIEGEQRKLQSAIKLC